MKGLLVAVGLLLFASPILGLAVLLGAGGGTGAAAATALCRTSGPVRGLDATQADNARAIVAAAQQTALAAAQPTAAQQRAELIALITAATETGLHNYASPTVAGSDQLPNDGDPPGGGDHDSVGLFQQRATWGPLADRMNPARATALFIAALLTIPAWQTTPPGDAAQAVQASAYPDRYAAHISQAQTWLTKITGIPAALQCGADGLPKSTGSGDDTVPAGTLPNGFTLPLTATDAERRAVTFALAQVGKPYVFGAAGPASYDCSGLTMAAWGTAGVHLPHYTVDQYHLGTLVTSTMLLAPGDLIFIPGSDGSLNPPNPRHVGMYIGHGEVIEAPQTGDFVKIVAATQFTPVIGIRRYG